MARVLQFFTAKMDWLDVWDIYNIDEKRINEAQKRAEETGNFPFTLRISTGSQEDHLVDECHGGISLDVLVADREINDPGTLLTIRIPWDTAKMIGAFMAALSHNPEM